MSALPVWSCEFKGADSGLTVGSEFQLDCRGEIEVSWNEATPQIVFPKKEQSYTLAVLKADRLEPLKAQLTVTGYKPGQHAPEYIRIVQGESGFEVAKPTWTIESVISQDQPPQPYAGFGPWSLAMPYWVLITAALLVILLVGLALRRFRRYTQRAKMLSELSRHKTALSPVNQFYRDARQLRRRINQAKTAEELKIVADELNKEFRLYVLRRFEIPTLDWSDREIVEDLRRRHKHVYRQASHSLKKMLRELTRMKSHTQPLLPDVEQIHRMSLDAVERIESAKASQRKGKGLL